MFTIIAVCLYLFLVAMATGFNLVSIKTGRKMLLVGCASIIFMFAGGCNAPKKCMVPGCMGLHRGVWEMDHQMVAQTIKSGTVKITVSQWLKARKTTTPDVKGWQDDDLHLKYYLQGYQIKDQRKAGWEDSKIFLTKHQIEGHLNK